MLKTGDFVSHYKIISAIGAGGMGEVFLAEDTKLGRRVAIKVLSAEAVGDSERMQRFIREAKAASSLNHPNILTIYEIGEHDGTQFISAEFIDGKTLRAHKHSGDVTVDQALAIALQAANALGAAHSVGIIHRDIKPENIMIRSDGLVKVLDFGLAKLSENSSASVALEDPTRVDLITERGVIMGTAAYMSPEQARGQKLDPRSDIFSLGIILYELFTGERPFKGSGSVDLISSILKDDPPRLRQFAPELPRHLERIVDKTLRKDRDHRYQHIKDLEIDLEDLREELKFEAKLSKTSEHQLTAPITKTEDLRPTFTERISSTRRFTLLHAFGFFMIFAVLAIAVAFWLHNSGLGGKPIADRIKTIEFANWSSAPGELFSSASFSPDGKMIAFSSTRSEAKNVWITQTGSSEAIQVTNDAFSNKDPIWSPKGDEIAFYSLRGDQSDLNTGLAGIWRVTALGGTPRSVGAITDGSFELRRWGASGKIYFQSNGDLHSIDVSSGEIRKTTSLGTEAGRVKWVNIAPDENSIAYAIQKDGNWTIRVSNVDNSSSEEISSGSGELGSVSWLPDKSRFFYSSTVDGVCQIYVVDEGGAPLRIITADSDSVVTDASPDGKSVIISSAKEDSNIWRVDIDGQRESPISRSINSDLWPAVSFDDSKIVYQSVKNMSRGDKLFKSSIVVRPIAGRDESATSIIDGAFLPSWSPDGSTIAMLKQNADNADNIELWTANPNGGGARRVTGGGIPTIGYSVSPYNHIHTNAYAWSPKDPRIAYISSRSGAANLWTISLNDGRDQQITQNTDANTSYYCPIWSSDATKIAYFSQKRSLDENKRVIRGISIVDVETNNVKDIFSSDANFRLIGWTSDDNGLIIAETERSGSLTAETVLSRIELSDPSGAEIGRLENAYFYNIFLSPDRKQIAFAARIDGKDDIWTTSAAGGNPRRVTSNNEADVYISRLAWVNDGNSIVFGKQSRFSLLSLITEID